MEDKAKKILARQLEMLAEESEALHGKSNMDVTGRIDKLCAITAQMASIADAMKTAGDW